MPAPGTTRPRAKARVRNALLLIAVLLVVRLVAGETPWSSSLEERAAEGKLLRPKDFARSYGWWAASVLLPLVAVLLWTLPRWLGQATAPRHSRPELSSVGRPTRAALLLAMLVGGVLAFPRLDDGLAHDERENVMHAIDGHYHSDGKGGVEFVERDWVDALWWYQIPANHGLHTVLAKLSVSAARLGGEAEHRLVDERALRVPAYLAGIAFIGAVGWLLARHGEPLAGVVAAWLVAVHPWTLRYASEARGYSLGLLGVPLLLLALGRALRYGTWRRWALFATLQGLLVWNHLSFAYFVVAVNAVAAVVLLRRLGAETEPGGRELAVQQLSRWFVSGVASAGVGLWLLAPILPQFVAFSRGPVDNLFDARTLADVGTHFWLGRFSGTGFTGLELAVGALVALALCAAVIRLARSPGPAGLVLPVLVLPTAISAFLAWWTGANFFPQYLIAGLPGALIVVSLGLVWLTGGLPRPVQAALLLGGVVLFAVATEPTRQLLESRSIQPFRESVAATRPFHPEHPKNREILTVWFDHFAPLYHDPRIERVRNLDELDAWTARAESSGQELFVNVSFLNREQDWHQRFVARLEECPRFVETADIEGLRPRDRRRVWRYRADAAPCAPLS
ncbi:MAG: hypothetical protein QNK05_14420 [Myxococcota bacterium]|nr:hypothetical protein [Myxococcota bacterium]